MPARDVADRSLRVLQPDSELVSDVQIRIM